MNCMKSLGVSFSILVCAVVAASCGSTEVIVSTQCDAFSCDPEYCGDKCDRYQDPVDEDDNEPPIVYDSDGDTIPNNADNCKNVPNPDQKDSNNNGLGDACEEADEVYEDTDGDTIIDINDNCVFEPNPDQLDSDDDGRGDACSEDRVDNDLDGDTIPDDKDNCVRVSNPDQADRDGNGVGDACDTPAGEVVDVDGDTIPNDKDNCPDTPNHDQADRDGNGIGDACDVVIADRDGDTIPDDKDNCPDVKNPDQADADGDGKGDACAPAVVEDGTQAHPYIIKVDGCGASYRHAGDTSKSSSSLIDNYSDPKNLNESGPEVYYKIVVTKKSVIDVTLDEEPSGVDIDVHLIRGLESSGKTLNASNYINRADRSFSSTVAPGTYYIVADTYNGAGNAGKYVLNVSVMPEYAGTKEDPILLNCGNPLPPHFAFNETRSTKDATSRVFDKYPDNSTDESGPEFIYQFKIAEKSRFYANIRKPEASGSDTDLHLLSSLDPKLIKRDDLRVWTTLEPGTYYLTADACNNKTGQYILDIQSRPVAVKGEHMFNEYILKAVKYLYNNWAKRGYGSSAYTHDLKYGADKITKGPQAPLTMCVAAVAETILVAMDLYAQETGDTSIWSHLPRSSWSSLSTGNIKAHIWVNPDINAGGTGDAVAAFGMGMNVPFEELVPGSFVNINRSNGTGHAVVFLAFLDANCKEYETYNDKIVGFKYFSSQGSSTNGGFDYRYCRFENKTFNSCKDSNGNSLKTDAAIYSTKPTYLNTGVIYMPKYWLKTSLVKGVKSLSAPESSYFNAEKFNGITISD